MDNSNFENIISMADSKEDRDKASIHPLKKKFRSILWREKDFKVRYSILKTLVTRLLDLNL